MALTALEKATIESIINIFETGEVRGDYGNITLIAGDSGGLTYGRSQTTINSGNLYLLIRDYCQSESAIYADSLRHYLARLQSRSSELNQDTKLKALLKSAGNNDPVMRIIQDSFFDRVYWQPAARAAAVAGITTPLGIATVYDGFIHGSWLRMSQRATASAGMISDIAFEKKWVIAYLDARRAWLKSMPPPLPNTTYRQDAFKALIADNNWDLTLPITIRGLVISEEAMGIGPKGWTLFINKKELGLTWQNPNDQFRNYYPVRDLLIALFPEPTVSAGLQFDSATKVLYWQSKPLIAPLVERGNGTVWVQLRAFAGAMSLTVVRDIDTRTLTLERTKVI